MVSDDAAVPAEPARRLDRGDRAGEGSAGGTGAGRRDAKAAEINPASKPVSAARQPLATLAELKAGLRPGLSAVAETRVGILQYLPDEAVVGDAIGWYGEYLQPQLDLLARIVRPGATMMEVGAGVGAHAVFLGTLLGEAAHLFLYESRPVLQRILRQNLAANRVSNVTVMRGDWVTRGRGKARQAWRGRRQRSRPLKRSMSCNWSAWTGLRSMKVSLH